MIECNCNMRPIKWRRSKQKSDHHPLVILWTIPLFTHSVLRSNYLSIRSQSRNPAMFVLFLVILRQKVFYVDVWWRLIENFMTQNQSLRCAHAVLFYKGPKDFRTPVSWIDSSTSQNGRRKMSQSPSWLLLLNVPQNAFKQAMYHITSSGEVLCNAFSGGRRSQRSTRKKAKARRPPPVWLVIDI